MDKRADLRQYYQAEANKQNADKQHQERAAQLKSLESTVVHAFGALIKLIDGKTTKTEVVNQPKSISTPDVDKVVQAVDSLPSKLKKQADESVQKVDVQNLDFSKLSEAITGLTKVEGKKGDKGEDGHTPVKGVDYTDGKDGRTVELRTNSTHIQYRYEGEATWTDIISTNSLKGERGYTPIKGVDYFDGKDGKDAVAKDGKDGAEVELRKTAKQIQWRRKGGKWAILVKLADLKGDTGKHVGGGGGGPGIVKAVIAGTGISIDSTDVYNPIISATGLAEASDLTAHTGNTSNPHSVTKAQVGLGNVNDTSDLLKPISTATQTALDGKFTQRTITGTTNQVTVTNGNGVSGNPTLSLPQDIHTGASPTFAGVTSTGLTATQIVATDGAKKLQTLTTATYPSLTELSYVKGLTSSVQNQLNTNTITTTRLVEPTYTLASATPVTSRPLFDILRGDHTAFLPAEQIIIEQSVDGGTTWTDAGVSDVNKRKLFSGERPNIPIPQIAGVMNTLCMIRVTISAMRFNVPGGTAETDKYSFWTAANVLSAERYCTISEAWVWVNSITNKIQTTIERANGATPNSWSTIRTAYMNGWSGGNYTSIPAGTFGGGTHQTGNAWNYRFTFRTASPSNTLVQGDLGTGFTTQIQTINHIKTSGQDIWTVPNRYAYNEHIYSWDYLQNVTFPADVKATSLSLSNLATGGFVSTFNALAPNLLTTQTAQFRVGVALSGNNVAEFNYYYVGSGSTSNTFKLGMWGNTDIITYNANGNITIGTNTAGTHTLTFDDNRNIVLGSTTGTKIGTATNQKLGFFNATPVVQPSATPVDATDLATALTLVNDLKSKLVTLGLIA